MASESHLKDFLELNPNGKIPVIVDPNGPNGEKVIIFESGAILTYLSDKYHELTPSSPCLKIETTKWLFWASSGFSTQCKTFGFYYKYCHHKLPFCVERHSTECKRLLSVLNYQLGSHGKHWVTGDYYTIADLAIWPWLNALHENYDDAGPVSLLHCKYENSIHCFTNTCIFFIGCLRQFQGVSPCCCMVHTLHESPCNSKKPRCYENEFLMENFQMNTFTFNVTCTCKMPLKIILLIKQLI